MKQCEFCAKGHFMSGTRKLLRGHYNPTNWTRKHSNLQWYTWIDKPGRVKACVKCIKQMNKKFPKPARAAVKPTKAVKAKKSAK